MLMKIERVLVMIIIINILILGNNPNDIIKNTSAVNDGNESFEILKNDVFFSPGIAISNATQLQNMKNNLTEDYYLTTDIDCSGTASWNNGSGFSPVGDQADNFLGTLDGKGFKIINLTINRSTENRTGLFGVIGLNAVIEGIQLHNADVLGLNYVGALVGSNVYGIVNNSNCNGTIRGTDRVGGIVGNNKGPLSNSSFIGKVEGYRWIGGIIGLNYWNIHNCTSTIYVSESTNYVGGLIGNNDMGDVEYCSSSGKITGANSFIGGLVGSHSDGKITHCSSSVDVSAHYGVGGLAGSYSDETVINCYSNGNVIGTDKYIGGLIGINSGTITKCYSNGTVDGKGTVGGLVGTTVYYSKILNCNSSAKVNGSTEIGGLVGLNDHGTVEDSFAIGNVTGSGTIGGLMGKNQGFLNRSYATNTVEATSIIAGGLIGKNIGFINDSFATGRVKGKYVVGGLCGENVYSIRNSYSTGVVTGSDLIGGFVGQNRLYQSRIINCYATGSVTGINETGGFIGYIESGFVNDSYATGDVTATGHYVGGLIGDCYRAYINRTYYTGKVTGTNQVGGLIGSSGFGKVNVSFADANVTGILYVGGLIGAIGYSSNPMIIENSYSRSKVSGTNYVGGFSGENSHTIRNCYSSGQVTGTSNTGGFLGSQDDTTFFSFWDNITSGYTSGVGTGSSVGITGKNTSEMKTKSTFMNANWDFVDVWAIRENITYPYFINNYISTPPIITTVSIPAAIEDIPYKIKFNANHDINEQVTWKIITNGTWLTINNAIPEITGTPVNEDVGNYWVNVSIADNGGNQSSRNFTLEVINVNDNPEITTPDVTTVTEDVSYSVIYDAFDIDPTNDVLTWSYSSNATSWLNFNSITRELSGTPSNNNVGKYWVNISVKDGKTGISSNNFILTVFNYNDAPTIVTSNIDSIIEDELYLVDYNAIDIDPTSDTLTWNLETSSQWLSMDAQTGLLTGTPGNEHVGIWEVMVSVDDGKDGSDSTTFNVTVENENDDPVINTTGIPTSTKEDVLFAYYIEATDIDPTNDELTFHLSSNSTWLDLDISTGLMSGTPTNDDVGTYWVNISTFDGNGGRDYFESTIVVINVNDPPQIITDDIVSGKVGKEYSVDYKAIDIDPAGDDLSWSLDTNASDWLSMNTETGKLSGIPETNDFGSFWVMVTVDDGNGGTDHHLFNLTVKSSKIIPSYNFDPVISTNDVIEVLANEKYWVDYDATDDRTPAEELNWTFDTNATWLNFSSTTSVLYGFPLESDVGSYWVEIVVMDDENGSVHRKFTLYVRISEPQVLENHKPILSDGKSIPNAGNSNTDFTFSVHYSDEDGDIPVTIKVVINGDENDMTISQNDDGSDGMYMYITKLPVGIHNYYFTASDGKSTAVPDDNTPTTVEDAGSAYVTPEKLEEKKGGMSNWFLYLIPVIIIGIILIFIFVKRKSKPISDQDNIEQEPVNASEIEPRNLEEDASSIEHGKPEQPPEMIIPNQIGETDEVNLSIQQLNDQIK
jgi:hypothetical protein